MKSAFFVLLFSLVLSCNSSARDLNITFAVGHDHDKMLAENYAIYRANWEFVGESLGLLGYTVTTQKGPWARAKLLTQTGKADGLFLAANLEGRDKWATLSKPLGFGVFGTFYHTDKPNTESVIAAIRLGEHDKILSAYHPDELLQVATAHQGFRLLFNKKVDKFIMSESYGSYLLQSELKHYSNKISFNHSLIEKRSIHIAFAKEIETSLVALQVVNDAIELGMQKGLYREAMKRNKVPLRMWLESQSQP